MISAREFFNRPLPPCPVFFNRDPIDRPDSSRRNFRKIVGCTLILSDNYPIIGSLTDNIFLPEDFSTAIYLKIDDHQRPGQMAGH